MCLFSFNLVMATGKFGAFKYGFATVTFPSHFYVELCLKMTKCALQDFVKLCIFQK